MAKFIPKMTDQKEAIEMLFSVGILVMERAYGFRVALPAIEAEKNSFIECGTEHDGSISLSMPNPKAKSEEWFFRFSFTEAAEFIIESFKKLEVGYSAIDVVESMKANDEQYDHAGLEKRLQQQAIDFQEYFKESS